MCVTTKLKKETEKGSSRTIITWFLFVFCERQQAVLRSGARLARRACAAGGARAAPAARAQRAQRQHAAQARVHHWPLWHTTTCRITLCCTSLVIYLFLKAINNNSLLYEIEVRGGDKYKDMVLKWRCYRSRAWRRGRAAPAGSASRRRRSGTRAARGRTCRGPSTRSGSAASARARRPTRPTRRERCGPATAHEYPLPPYSGQSINTLTLFNVSLVFVILFIFMG